MARKVAGKSKHAPQRHSREQVCNIRLSVTEREYLGRGAAREEMGPVPLSTFLRGLALRRAAQTLGYTLAEFEARQRKLALIDTPKRSKRRV